MSGVSSGANSSSSDSPLTKYEVVYPVEVTHVSWDDQPVEPTKWAAFLCYTTSEPYTTFLCFEDDPRFHWEFARDLLIDGRRKKTGDGAVTVSPAPQVVCEPSQVSIQLVGMIDSKEARTVFTVPTADINKYLRKTFRFVARDDESKFMDMDMVISKLLEPRQNTEGHSAT